MRGKHLTLRCALANNNDISLIEVDACAFSMCDACEFSSSGNCCCSLMPSMSAVQCCCLELDAIPITFVLLTSWYRGCSFMPYMFAYGLR
jgi:hypothetical protein